MKQKMPPWRVDNLVPIAGLAITLVINVGALFWWGGRVDLKLENMQRTLTEIKDNDHTRLQSMNRLQSHVCTLDTIHNIVCIANQ